VPHLPSSLARKSEAVIELVPDILVQDELKSGALVALLDPMVSGRNYDLAYTTRYQYLSVLKTFSA
jgi:hypothetical protein